MAVAWAEDTPKAPPGTRQLADTPFQLVLPSEHLLGDWFGARTWLEEHGVTPTVTFVTDALGNPTGGMRQGFRGASNLGLDLLFDLEKIFGLGGASFEISFSARSGSSLSKEDIGNVFSVQQDFGGETYRLVDVAYRQQLLGDRVEFRVGRIAAGDDFLVSPYNYVFVQNGFDGNPVGVFLNAPGMTAYPNATWGGLAKVRPTERTYVMGGLYNGDPSIRDNNHHGADWSMAGPLFAMAEVGFQVNGRPGDRGLLGNYKVGFWYDDSQYTDFNTVARGLAPQVSRWALRINLLTGLVNILATIPAIALIDRAGRKPLLLAGSAGMTVTLGAMAIVFATAGIGANGKPLLTHAAAVTGLAAANLYIVAFAMSWGPVMWVLLGEMFPNRMRGAGAYALYALAAMVSLPFVWAAVRETRGKTLEQM